MIWVLLVVLSLTCGSNGAIHKSEINDNKVSENEIVSQTKPPPVPCTCGVFLSGQFVKGSQDQPKGYPALLQEQEQTFPCTNLGNKQCTNKCLDIVSILSFGSMRVFSRNLLKPPIPTLLGPGI